MRVLTDPEPASREFQLERKGEPERFVKHMGGDRRPRATRLRLADPPLEDAQPPLAVLLREIAHVDSSVKQWVLLERGSPLPKSGVPDILYKEDAVWVTRAPSPCRSLSAHERELVGDRFDLDHPEVGSQMLRAAPLRFAADTARTRPRLDNDLPFAGLPKEEPSCASKTVAAGGGFGSVRVPNDETGRAPVFAEHEEPVGHPPHLPRCGLTPRPGLFP